MNGITLLMMGLLESAHMLSAALRSELNIMILFCLIYCHVVGFFLSGVTCYDYQITESSILIMFKVRLCVNVMVLLVQELLHYSTCCDHVTVLPVEVV